MIVRLVVPAGLVLLAATAAIVVPLLAGPIQFANPASACGDSGQIAGEVMDTTDLVHPWFAPHPVCPLTFSEMYVLVIRRPDSTGPPHKNPVCFRNRQEIECGP